MNVIIVDDSKFSVMFLKNTMVKLGFNVVGEASNGRDAIELTKKEQPDLVLLDITMPDMDGLTALPKIKENSPNTKVIMCSAMGEKDFGIEAMNRGAIGFVTKPFDANQIKDTFEKLNIIPVEKPIEKQPQVIVQNNEELVKDNAKQVSQENIKQPQPKRQEIEITPQEYYDKAVAHEKLRNMDEAIGCLNRAIMADSNFIIAYYKKAEILTGLGKNKEVLETYNNIININSNDIEAYYAKAKILGKLGNKKEQDECLKKCLDISPEFGDKHIDDFINLYYERAINAKSKKDYKEAIRCFDKLLNNNIKNPKIYFGIASSLYSINDFSRAVVNFDKGYEIGREYIGEYAQEYSDACYNIGVQLKAEGKDSEAQKYFDRAMEINPDNVKVIIDRARTLYHTGNYEKALECFREVIKLDSKNIEVMKNIFICLCKLEKLQEAKDYILLIKNIESAENDKISPDTHYNLSLILYMLGEYEAALQEINGCLSVDVKNQQAYNNKGLILCALGKYEEAIANFDNAIEMEKVNSFAYFNKGIALKEICNYFEAIKCFESAINIDNNHYLAHYYKGIELKELGKVEDALSSFDKAINIDKDFILPYYGKGCIYKESSEFEKAIKCFNKVIEGMPEFYIAYYNKGECLRSLDKQNEAMECYDKVIELNCKFADAYYAKGCVFDALRDHEEAKKYYSKSKSLSKNTQKYDKEIERRNVVENKSLLDKIIEFVNSLFSKGKVEEPIKVLEKENNENLDVQDYSLRVGNVIYYNNKHDKDKLYTIDIDSKNRMKICDDSVSYINVNNGWIYYCNNNDGNKIYRIYKDGKQRGSLSIDRAAFLKVKGNWIYYRNDLIDGNLYKMDINASSRSKLCETKVSYIEVFDDWICYCNELDNNKIYRIKTDGTQDSKISEDSAQDITYSDGWLYYSNVSDGYKIYKIKGNGTQRTKVNEDNSEHFTIIGEWIYYKNSLDGNRRYRIKTDGTNKMKLNDSELFGFSILGNYYSYKE